MPDIKTELQEKWAQLAKVPATEKPFTEPEEKEKITRNRLTSTPVFTRVLVDKLGICIASERLGMSRSGLRTAFDRDRISTVAEIAAKGVLDAMKAKEKARTALDTADRIVVIRVPSEKYVALQAVLDAMQLTVKEV